jgi:3-deoxy-7-phosphoheptulonate synthase
LVEQGARPAVMIDASHDNSSKDPTNQPKVVADIAAQVARGDERIFGVMIESNLVGGKQVLVPGQPLVYGKSITDGCIGWTVTEAVLNDLAQAVVLRRKANSRSVA